ncbi:hypothetical protein Dsin_004146 [Dipteronia sinensis]|uniref:Uncharacterized protein n=1 Tax=Dipteronia sinensis TaxID=43782 RepID=A0AAE0BAG1_9ROSI|nr:hypothetical protein Dsin_004146 [Dipteronia sinensis]
MWDFGELSLYLLLKTRAPDSIFEKKFVLLFKWIVQLGWYDEVDLGGELYWDVKSELNHYADAIKMNFEIKTANEIKESNGMGLSIKKAATIFNEGNKFVNIIKPSVIERPYKPYLISPFKY